MTLREFAQVVSDRTNGTNEGFVNFDGLKVKVQVIDYRKAFGRDDILVTPLSGKGEKWIDLNSLQVE